MKHKIFNTDNSKTTILIRLMVGTVFFSEGIQKFLFDDTLGAGRFEKIGLPSPEFLGSFVGTFEILLRNTYSDRFFDQICEYSSPYNYGCSHCNN